MDALLGPIWFIRDSAPPNILTGIILLPLLAAAFLQVAWKPRNPLRYLIALLALFAWLFLGIVGSGIKV